MHIIKASLFSIGSLTVGSLAQSFSSDPACPSSLIVFGAAAPVLPSSLETILPNPASILRDPEDYASSLCKVAAELPASQLAEFASWGQSLLRFASTDLSTYDALVTKCFATGAEAAAATSYIHSIVSQTAPLCQMTSTPGGKTGSSNGTTTITPAPTPTSLSISPRGNSSTTTMVVTGLATKPTSMFAGVAGVVGLLATMALL
ncbi:hypothetical protein HD806DRAFT_517065 [Xylariaceae sp. AK1471]|nr:hypothetical protein HD806DRAFT_517065 [Xylariaceae sp. AK1471]